jgi:hypothetical protein
VPGKSTKQERLRDSFALFVVVSSADSIWRISLRPKKDFAAAERQERAAHNGITARSPSTLAGASRLLDLYAAPSAFLLDLKQID